MSITLLDGILIVIMIISAILAMIRGFSREVLSIISWVVAGAAALFFHEQMAATLTEMIPQMPDNELVKKGIAAAVIFLIVLIIVSYLTMLLADMIIDSRIGVLDRTLGFIFGAARGFLLVTITLMGFLWLAGDKLPSWVENARSKQMMESVGTSIKDALPENMDSLIKKYFDNPDGQKIEGEQESEQKT